MVSVLLSTEEDKNHTQDNLLPSPLESRTQALSGQPGYETSLVTAQTPPFHKKWVWRLLSTLLVVSSQQSRF